MYNHDLIRHAESKWVEFADKSPVPLFGGRMNDVELSDNGRLQAMGFGAYARDRHLSPLAIFSSPAQRCLQTHELSSRVMGAPVTPIVDDRLQERDWGLWTGQERSIRDQEPFRTQRLERGNDFAPPNGQSINDVLRESYDFVNHLIANYPEGYYWAHTHRNRIKAVVGHLLSWTTEQITESDLAVVSRTRLLIDNGQMQVSFYNQPSI